MIIKDLCEMKKMHVFFRVGVLLLSAMVSAGCNKEVKEDTQLKLLTDVMTSGRWLVESFTENGVDLSAEFAGIEFQFFENGSVQGIQGGVVTTGSWSPIVDSYSIQSHFTQGSTTLKRLNDTWKITNSTLSLVEAKPLASTRTAFLKLVKR